MPREASVSHPSHDAPWICSSCDGFNLAVTIVCAHCSNPRDASDRAAPAPASPRPGPAPRAAPPSGDAEVLGELYWNCPGCGAAMPARARRCARCGTSRGDAVVRVPPLGVLRAASSSGSSGGAALAFAIVVVEFVVLIALCGGLIELASGAP